MIGGQIIMLNDYIKLMENIELIDCHINVITKEGQSYILEQNNAFNFRNHIDTSFLVLIRQDQMVL